MAALVVLGLAALAAACGGASSEPAFGPLEPPYSDDVLALGKRVHDGTCTVCHEADGSGGIGPALTGVEARLSADDHLVVVARGRGQMQPFANLLTPEEIQAVVAYQRTAFR